MKEEQNLNLEEEKDWEEYKFTPISLFDILGMERWLEKLANQGLFPVHLGPRLCWFNHTGVPGTRFRLEPYGQDRQPTLEQLGMYDQAGWTYVMPVANTYFLFCAADPESPELYSDWSSRGMSLDRLARRARRLRMFWMCYLPIFFAIDILIPILSRGNPSGRWLASWQAQMPLLLLHMFKPIYFLLLLTILWLMPLRWYDGHVLVKTYRNLKNGLPPPPTRGYNRWVWLDNATTIPSIILCCLLCVLTVKIEVGRELKEFTQPYVSLVQIEQTQAYSGGWFFREFSLLAPVWYQVEESVYASAHEAVPGEAGHPIARMDMTRLRLLIPPLARGVAEAEMARLRVEELSYRCEELEVPGLDFALLARDETGASQLAALGRGGWVAVFRYSGGEKLSGHLELLASMVTQDAAAAP